ncbi:hypothetical protein K1T71_014783 [Dendrolimus kikuchii]|nr:hypothetical protein K1T71_014783 [Dendrolimus kikuchii]
MSEEKELIKKRGSFKGRLTVFSNYLDGLLDTSLEGDDVSELQLRLRRMESMYEPYDEVQMRLECIVDDVQSQMSERSEFESLYYKTLSRAKNMLSNYNKEIQSQHSDRASIHKPVKLPTIQLPKFNGNYNNWLEFRDTFTSLIHHNDEIDDINKFHYLRASLEGSAAVVIQSIEFSMTNYSVAWNLLCDRFDNTNLLIQNHISALFNIEVISKESSVALKGLIDQLNKNLRALESLGEPVKHWDTLLIYIITRKLDQKTFREWEEFKGRLGKDKPVLFEAFMRFIRNRADLVETLELSRNNSSHTPTKSSPKFKSLVTTQSPNDSSNYMSPKPDYQNYSISHLTRFQRIEQLRQHFWTRWSKEFVAELQQRVKWRSCKDSLKLDSLVVVKDENLPPLKWKLGRVVAVHPGSDGIVRVADIKTATGVIRRAFNRICPLPVSTGSV